MIWSTYAPYRCFLIVIPNVRFSVERVHPSCEPRESWKRGALDEKR